MIDLSAISRVLIVHEFEISHTMWLVLINGICLFCWVEIPGGFQ